VLANDVKYLGIAATIYLAVIGFAWLDPKIDPGLIVTDVRGRRTGVQPARHLARMVREDLLDLFRRRDRSRGAETRRR